MGVALNCHVLAEAESGELDMLLAVGMVQFQQTLWESREWASDQCGPAMISVNHQASVSIWVFAH